MPKPHLVVTPFTLREEGADKELADISATIEASMPQPARRFWHEIFDVEEWRLLSGLSLGLALAFISIALNGLTDHLLFNIPSSMFFWLLAALAAAVFLMQEDEEDIVEAEENKATLLEVVKAKFEATVEDVRQAKPEAKLEEILNLKPEAAPEAKPEAEADEKKEPEQEKEVQPKEEEESPKAEAELEEKLKLFEKMKKPEDRKEGAADHEEGKD